MSAVFNKISIKLWINGEEYELEVAPQETLLDLLRNDLKLFGTKHGCGEGECGACTVMMDGKSVNSCLVLAVKANGCKIITIEGLARGDRIHPIQEAFMEEGGLQCGFCTPGMIISAYTLLQEKPEPSEEEIRMAINGNICRCTGYQKIVRAIGMAARKMRKEVE